jgi:Zn-dependent M28 family amino/carboxypeptidase
VPAPRGRTAIAVTTALGVVATLATTITPATSADPAAAATATDQRADRQPDRSPFGADSRKLQDAVRTPKIIGHLRQLQVVADRYGDRAAGQEGYNASSRYVEHQLRAAGYTPRRQYFPFTYTRVLANTVTVEDAALRNVVLTGSPSTPDGGVTAPLVAPAGLGCDAADYAGLEATGKIALVNRGTCTFAQKSQAAGAAGAVAMVLWNNAATPFTGGTLGEDLEGVVPSTGIDQADGQALVAELAQGPVTATVDLGVLVEQRRTWNVIAETKRGRADNVVVLGGHLDGVQDGPGINDNGSGSATLLEIAIQLKKQEKRLKNKVRFAWWGAEELGLLGSTAYVNHLVATDPGALDDIAVYLNFDMVGSPNFRVGVYDADESTEAASAPVPAGSIETERVIRRYFADARLPVVDTAFSGRSDYQAFIVNGVAAGGLFSGGDGIKTAQEVRLFGGTAGIAYDPHYHAAGDSIRNVNHRSVDIFSNAIAHLTISLGRSTAAIDVPNGRPAPKRVTPVVERHEPAR